MSNPNSLPQKTGPKKDFASKRQIRDQETPEELQAIREALIEGEKSGFSDRSVDEIWEEARQRHRSKDA